MKLLYEAFTAPGVQPGTGRLNIRRISLPHYSCVFGDLRCYTLFSITVCICRTDI